MSVFFIKKGDQAPSLRCRLLDGSLQPINLSSASSVALKMQGKSLTGVSSVLNEAVHGRGVVSHAWSSSDTNTPGEFRAEWKITWGSGLVQTVPSEGFFTVKVVDDFGG